jgi:hypothetical protein
MIHSPLWTCSLPARRRGSSFVARPKLIRSGESTVTATKRSLILGHDLPGRAPTRGPGSDVPTPTGPLFLRLRGPQLPRVSSATGEFRPPRTLRVELKATRESRCPKPITVMPTKGLFQGCAWPPSAWDALRAEGITTLDRLRAVADQLEKLPGIGPRTARHIREELGSCHTIRRSAFEREVAAALVRSSRFCTRKTFNKYEPRRFWRCRREMSF